MNKNKNGFTLVELLAVIAILAILVIIALPNVMGMFNEAKKNSFTTELKQIYKTAQQTYISDSMFDQSEQIYARCKAGKCDKELDLSGRTELEYFIKFDKAGNVIEYYATDGTYQYAYKGNSLLINDIGTNEDVIQISQITNNKYVYITCSKVTISSPPPATDDEYMMAGIDGSGKYLRTNIAKQDIEKIIFTDSISGHIANNTDCWDLSKGQVGSVLAWAEDSNSNGLYEITIGSNGDIYLSSGYCLFNNLSNLIKIEGFENVNTSRVTNMAGMFYQCNKLEAIDLSHFDTFNVTTMKSMFAGCRAITQLDVSSFDTSNVTDMYFMFGGTRNLLNLDLSNFNTKKVTNMEGMFNSDTYGFSSATTGATTRYLRSVNLNSFDTSNVTTMKNMFHCGGSGASCSLQELDLSSFDTSKVTDMGGMFNSNTSLKKIYVSDKFKTDAVTSDYRMFANTSNLKGGQGTSYSTSHWDKTYARIDGGATNPGYFTRR